MQRLCQEPRNKFRLSVSFIPGVMTDAGIFRIAHIGFGSLQRLRHLAGFFHGNSIIRVAVKNPDGQSCITELQAKLAGIAFDFL